eukprot:37033_1
MSLALHTDFSVNQNADSTNMDDTKQEIEHTSQLYSSTKIMTNDCSYFVLEETESNMLVFAFIRLTITKHASNMYMPPYLIHLFVTFYYEAMPTFNITKYGSINYSQFEISRNITSDNKYPKVYCVSQIPW